MAINNNDIFPFSIRKCSISDYSPNLIHCHWHPEAQITYILEGAMLYQINNKLHELHAGDSIFISSGVFHAIKPLNPAVNCSFLTFTWQPFLISGGENTVVFHKYISPICSETDCFFFHFQNNTPLGKDAGLLLLKLDTIYQAAETGYELQITENLCSLWIALYNEFLSISDKKEAESATEINRLKAGICFIQSHFTENVSLQDISDSCQVSKSECCHLFKHILGQSPFSFLLNCRIQAGISLLLENNKSMAEIAEELGFNGSSYFAESFKKVMNCSPRDYKKLHKADTN